ncbi:MAG: hypothetical protein EBQ94_13730 [Flavobacteriales bacterium]|nr:hypothetical protein [Flavobacteriales bacterium]
MKIYVENFFYQIVKYRIHISCIFFFLLINNNLRVTKHVDYSLIFSLTFWHFSLFLFDRVYDREIDKLSQPNEYVKEKYSCFLYVVVFLLIISSLISYLNSGYKIIYWIILLPIVFLYPLRIFGDFRIKQIFLVKNLFSALLIFCFPLILQAILLSNGQVNYNNLIQPILSLFIYVMIGEVFWDIRDCSIDKQFNIKTIPNTFGIKKTKIYILSLIIIDSILTQTFFSSSAIIYFVLITFIKENSNRLIFHFPPLIALFRFLI